MNEEDFIILKSYALKLLSFRQRTQQEIKSKLQEYSNKKHLETNTLEKVMSYLQEQSLINDTEFAKWWIQSRKNFRIKGKKVIRLELLSKGIDKDTIDDLLKDQDSGEELTKAQKIIEKKFKEIKNKPVSQLSKIKASKFLYRKGFESGIIKKAIDEA